MTIGSVIGDSITFAYGGGGLVAADHYPYKIQTTFSAAAPKLRVRNFGVSGNTTTQMVARKACLDQYEVPDFAVIYGGLNDPDNAINAATTQANLETLAEYIQDAGCERVLIVGVHFMNWSSGGDTVATQNATYSTLRTAQQAAGTAAGASYVDAYDYFGDLITAGDYTQGTWAGWHYADSNVHLNATGQTILAAAISAKITALGWDDDFV
jgi:lysophospholipase L1-like esterase